MSRLPRRGQSGLLRAYLALTALFPFALRHLARKAHIRQGAAPERLAERFGQASVPRPEGPLIWLHASSVGELISVLDLAEDMAQASGAHLLFTTATTTAARTAQARMPKGATHQFLPIDTPAAVRQFLDLWHPDLACFVESDLWPRMVFETHRRAIPLALINARPSRSRTRSPATAAALLSCFERVTTQDNATRDQILALGLPLDKVLTTGDLKSAASPLPVDAVEKARMAAQIGPRPVWVAASTHPGEEEQVIAAHAHALNHLPDLLLILIPRHPERGPALAAEIRAAGLTLAQRSAQQSLQAETQVYLADTLGETGLFYAIAPLVFLGGSFGPQGGHNPFEPAQVGGAVLHGPHVENFTSAYAELAKCGGSLEVDGSAALGQTVAHLLSSPDLVPMQAAARAMMADKAHIRRAVLKHLAPLLAALDDRS
ncbi:3-deoxy-D-manno-octulosonic acid transferase [Thalassovita taeanensis]|uniref:3-deoxy-D-manno-octulosonic acid transferase n=1 Tax=Thalassovita taeanensis TaxID=657014 RepID=A0A1H9FLI1_9RHOB|nr:glycosyltransferase N-terminal domain-containing protein [Thalassovita taeanensis]SEQ38781.1 3-deoxy-D-manno-octulosonic-acid transferase [Thalassovita taeanensis]